MGYTGRSIVGATKKPASARWDPYAGEPVFSLRDQIKAMEEAAKKDWYYEIPGDAAGDLARAIRKLIREARRGRKK